MSGATFGYRPDIDGLRGIAVLAVIAFHVDADLLPGGFIGVDVFFVISGYLITGLILGEMAAQRFTVADFYRRRIKRIAPAMLTVIAVTLVAAQLLLLPTDAEAVARSALASLAGLANVWFWLFIDTGYFAPDAREVPLLHLWSLGVEEQFYLIWPLLLIALHRRFTHLPRVPLALFALASFAAGSLLYPRAPGFVFYMLPTRAGELLLGALLADAVMRGDVARLPHRLRGPLGVAGCAGLAASLVLVTERAAFPGLVALAPTLATAALIVAGAGGASPITAALGAAPLRATGLLSYSAYLWHWPLLAFAHYAFGDLGVTASAAIVALTFGLAWASWYWIETPARRSTRPPLAVLRQQYLAPAAALGLVAAAAIAVDGHGLHAFSSSYATALAAQAARIRPAHVDDRVCQRARIDAADLDAPRCVLGPASQHPRVLLWGDSNAAHYVGVLQAFAEQGGFGFRNVEIQSCPPLASDPAPFVYPRNLDDCRASLAIVNERLAQFEVVVLAASWTGYQATRGDFLTRLQAFADDLAAAGKLVVLLGKAPVPDDFDRRCGAKALRFPGLDCRIAPTVLDEDVASVNARLQAFAAGHAGVEYFDLSSHLCNDGPCRTHATDGTPLYLDPHHLTLDAARAIGAEILAQRGLPAAFSRIARWPTQASAVTAAGAHRPPNRKMSP